MTASATVELQRATGYQLIARDEAELRAAHEHMIAWAEAQRRGCETDLVQERDALAVAEERKWATAPFRRRIGVLEKRIVFYEKIRLALEAGYVIVPNFPLNVFAIRTDLRAPRFQSAEGGWRGGFRQSARLLPAGKGEFQPALVPAITEERREGEKVVRWQHPDEEWGEIEFPLALAKPVLMEGVARAMAERVFDEIGVAEDASRTGDPILVGRLRNPRQGRPDVSFFLGWYFDPSRI